MKNLNEIAREVLVEESRMTPHKLQQVMQLGVRAVREINIDITGQLKTVILTPSSFRTISVPADYFNYSKLGVCIGGQIYNLGRNDSLCFPHMTNDCGELQPEPFFNSWPEYMNLAGWGGLGWYYWNFNAYNENGEFTGKLYGVGSGFNRLGYYRYNEQTREFVLTPHLQNCPIVLEYTSTGINNENILVPDEAIETVISFIRWKISNGSERFQFKAEYEQNLIKLRLRNFAFTMDEFVASVRQGYKQSPKQ